MGRTTEKADTRMQTRGTRSRRTRPPRFSEGSRGAPDPRAWMAPCPQEEQQPPWEHVPLTLNTWDTASSSVFQSTCPLTLLHPRKNSCCFKSCEAEGEASEPLGR